jgi:hypothetical protein
MATRRVDLLPDDLAGGFGDALDTLLGPVGASRPDPFGGASFGRASDPFAGATTGRNQPFAGVTYGRDNPFGEAFGATGGGQDQGGGGALSRLFDGLGGAAHRLFDGAFDKAPVAAKGPPTVGAVAVGSGATGADPGTDKWRALIDQAAAQYGIDGDAIQAVMMIESGGNERAQSPAGAIGLMQVMPFHWGAGEDPWNPQQNIAKGAGILADNFRRYGSWDKAVAAYLGAVDAQGNITGGADVLGTDGFEYAARFNANLARIKAARQQQGPQPGPRPQAAGGGMASIWGGTNASITQDYGAVTPGIDQDIYGYGAAYGLPQGHTGLDIGVRRGTQLYLPAGLTGVVETAGGTPYFLDEDYGDRGTPGKGELRIRLSNGDILILGHTSAINVRKDQQVTGGMALGQSGSAAGDHLHLEVRQRQADGSYRLVDPRAYFGQ